MKRRKFLAVAAGTLFASRVAGAQETTLPTYQVPDEHMPRKVRINKKIAPFEIHIVPDIFALYWTLKGGWAIRYTVGIGRPGLYEPGTYFVGAKKKWPNWTPTPDMISREPEVYAKFAEGMPGGIENPLGARALYLFTPERGDTFLRIHGTNEPSTIATAVSNGCARLVNDQIVSLYEAVPMGARVTLHNKS